MLTKLSWLVFEIQNWLDLFSVCVCVLEIHVLKILKDKNSVCFVYIGTCVPWMAIETKFSKFCIFCNLDEHLYAQLSKWALWLVFVTSKIKLSLILNTHITLFWWEGLKNPKRKALITISSLLSANHNMTHVCFGITKV